MPRDRTPPLCRRVAGRVLGAIGRRRRHLSPSAIGVDAVHYVFRVVVTDGSNEIAGETTVTMKARSDGVRDIELDLTSAAVG